MRYYDVYFEIYGKKMKANIQAESEAKAQEAIRNKIIFHKVVKNKGDYFNKSMDMLDDIINAIGRK